MTTTSRPRKVLALATTACLLLLLAGCGHATQHRTIAASLVDGKPGFVPTVITVDKENRVVMDIGNATDKTHGFTIEGYKIQRTVDPGQVVNVRFRASRGGTFRIYCQLHPAHQTATLVVR